MAASEAWTVQGKDRERGWRGTATRSWLRPPLLGRRGTTGQLPPHPGQPGWRWMTSCLPPAWLSTPGQQKVAVFVHVS
jgi:hypothetical protein